MATGAVSETMQAIGFILLICGILAELAGDLMILRSAYRQSVGTLFACLLLPLGIWFYALLDMRRPWMALGLSVGGLGLSMLGGYFHGIPLWEP